MVNLNWVNRSTSVTLSGRQPISDPRGHAYLTPRFAPSGKSVCIVGSGPAGLAAAHDLAILGFDVTIYEACYEPGGMLRYGIPDFRLPRDIIREEIQNILRLGISFKSGVNVGVDISLESLMEDFDAVLVASGCYESMKLGVPGENLAGVYPILKSRDGCCSGLQRVDRQEGACDRRRLHCF